jgi:hypothetical protein
MQFLTWETIMVDRATEQAAEAPIGWPMANIFDKTRPACARIAATLTVYAEAWGAALLYEDLSRLSDAELGRLGLPRAELHRHVFRPPHKG